MKEKILCWLTKLTTARDNDTPCVVRILALLTFFIFNGIAGYEVVGQGKQFPMLEYCSASSVLIGVVGAYLGLSKDTIATANSAIPQNSQSVSMDKANAS